MPDDHPRPHPRPNPGPNSGPTPEPNPAPRPRTGSGAVSGAGQRPGAPKSPAGAKPGELDRVVRDKVRALPATLTYLDLIRKNKRDSVLLIIAMFVLNAIVGAAIGGAVVPLFVGFGSATSTVTSYADTLAQDPMEADVEALAAEAIQAPGRILGLDAGVFRDTGRVAIFAAIGAGVMMLVTLGLALEAWFGGPRFLLNRVHAREITKEQDPELFNVVDEMRIAAGIPMPRVYLIPETALNAFATGRDPEHGVVAITTGLREKLTRDELQGVMAHEIAHIRHYDIRFALLMAMMVGLIVLACDALLRFAWYGGWASAGRRGRGDKRGGGAIVIIFMILALILAVVAPFLAKVIQMTYSRRREYLADAGAAELTRNPVGLASALSKLALDKEPLVETANRGMAHMFIMNPLRKRKSRHERGSLFSSHPPVADRIARLLALTR